MSGLYSSRGLRLFVLLGFLMATVRYYIVLKLSSLNFYLTGGCVLVLTGTMVKPETVPEGVPDPKDKQFKLYLSERYIRLLHNIARKYDRRSGQAMVEEIVKMFLPYWIWSEELKREGVKDVLQDQLAVKRSTHARGPKASDIMDIINTSIEEIRNESDNH
ncbi:MAG TPA: hypothetical protein VGB17_06280 [Pyrinomonadaceae bacterium]